jgi:hypothetical protein
MSSRYNSCHGGFIPIACPEFMHYPLRKVPPAGRGNLMEGVVNRPCSAGNLVAADSAEAVVALLA